MFVYDALLDLGLRTSELSNTAVCAVLLEDVVKNRCANTVRIARVLYLGVNYFDPGTEPRVDSSDVDPGRLRFDFYIRRSFRVFLLRPGTYPDD